MNPRLRKIIFGGTGSGGGGGGGGGTALERMTGPAVDLDWPDTNGSTFPFIDLMKSTDTFGPDDIPAGASLDTDDWALNVPHTGATISVLLARSDQYRGATYFPPGTYKARMPSALTAAGWRVRLRADPGQNIGGAVTSSAIGVTAQIVVPDLGVDGSYSPFFLRLDMIAPSTGGPTTKLSGVQVYNILDESLLDAGGDSAIFNPRFLADLSGWVKSVRVKDWVGTDNATIMRDESPARHVLFRRRTSVSYSELTKESSRTWGMTSWNGPFGLHDRGQRGNHVPYAICAKLARILNCGMMLAVPLLDDAIVYSSDAVTNTLYPCVFPDGARVVMENPPTGLISQQVYYVRDSVQMVDAANPGSFRLSLTLGGPPVTISQTRQGSDYLHSDTGFWDECWRIRDESEFTALYAAIAQECFNAAPGIDIIPDAGNECWNPNGAYGLQTCRKPLSHQTSSPGQQWAGYAWALMRAWEAFEAYYPRAQVVRIFLGQASYFNGFSLPGYGYTDARLHVGQTVANLIDAHCSDCYMFPSLTGTWEPAWYSRVNGPHIAGTNWHPDATFFTNEVVHTVDGKNWQALRNSTNVTPVEGADWHQIGSNSLVGGCTSWNDAQILEFGRLCCDQQQLYASLYKASGDALRTNPTPAGFIIYEGGPLWGGQSFISGMSAAVTRLKTWRNTAAEHATFINYYGAMLRTVGIKTVHQYQLSGGWRNNDDNDAPFFGIKRAPTLPDNPGSAAFKLLTL